MTDFKNFSLRKNILYNVVDIVIVLQLLFIYRHVFIGIDYNIVSKTTTHKNKQHKKE